jgi:hypothetical protein
MNIKEPKKPAHVLGNIIRCPRFIQCPLCYGCRAYDSATLECTQCEVNRKRDICNKQLHTDEVVSRFITKNQTQLDGDVKFESNDEGRS